MKPVRQLLNDFQRVNNTDPRNFLDSFYWSWAFPKKHEWSDWTEVESWCDNAIGNDNWIRIFNKLWFNTQSDWLAFKFRWEDESRN